jgi:hypothetical protein
MQAMTDMNAEARSTCLIGYANKPSKDAALKASGADAVITSMAEIAAALQSA